MIANAVNRHFPQNAPRILGCGGGRDDCSAPGRYDTGDRAGATDDIPQAIGAGDGRNGALNGRVDRIEIVHELGGFDRERVRGIKDVLVRISNELARNCLLYTSDAADE